MVKDNEGLSASKADLTSVIFDRQRLSIGRLSGFNYRQITKRINTSGFAFDRQAAGSHEILKQDALSK